MTSFFLIAYVVELPFGPLMCVICGLFLIDTYLPSEESSQVVNKCYTGQELVLIIFKVAKI